MWVREQAGERGRGRAEKHTYTYVHTSVRPCEHASVCVVKI